MTPAEVNRFNTLYQRHLRLLKLQGKSQKNIDTYSRPVRRVSEHCVSGTLKDFGLNPKNLGAQIGMTMVLYTYNRKPDFQFPKEFPNNG